MSKKVIVIGSGFGGLATAIRLQAGGHQVTVFEQRDKPGGRAYVYEEKSFVFDAGPTVITAPELLQELYSLRGLDMSQFVKLLPIDPFYDLRWDDGYRFQYGRNIESLEKQISDKNIQDWDGYQKFLEFTKKVYQKGYVELAAAPFLDFSSMIKVAPDLIRLKSYKSVYSLVADYIQDPHLRQAFSFHTLLVGGSPFRTPSIYTLIHYLERQSGVYFAKGGTGAIIRSLVQYFIQLGGHLYTNSLIDEITFKNGSTSGVRLSDGAHHEADAVVSNADLVLTYEKLCRSHPQAVFKTSKFKKMNHSMSLVVIYFGTSKKYDDVLHHTVLFGPRYKELLSDIFESGYLADDFSLYLHRSTASDDDLAPPGCDSFYVLAPVPNLKHERIDWEKTKNEYAQKILNYLEKKLLPNLNKNIVVKKIFTPNDFQSELQAFEGAAFSLEPTLSQSAYFRAQNKDRQIPGLYLVGAGTHPGAGVPGVLNSAKVTASLVAEDLFK